MRPGVRLVYGLLMTATPDALLGALAADALAMPVHWYYDRAALARDYGQVASYLAPRNPHPDSILWRSSYTALNARGDNPPRAGALLGPARRPLSPVPRRGRKHAQLPTDGAAVCPDDPAGPLRCRRVAGVLRRFHAHPGAAPRHLRGGISPGFLHELRPGAASPGRAAWPTCTSAGWLPCRRSLPPWRERAPMSPPPCRNTWR